MPQDASPPVVIAAPAEPHVSAAGAEVYGPIDTEGRPRKEECDQSDPNEIVVCATVDNEKYRLVLPPRPPKAAMQELGEALNVKIGNLEIGSIDRGDGTRAFGLRLKF